MEKNMEVDWASDSLKRPEKKEPKKSFEDYNKIFLKLEDPENTVRVVTNPFRFVQHKVVTAKAKFGVDVRCTEDDSCPCCAEGIKKQVRYYIGVISRKHNDYKIVNVNSAVVYDLKALREKPKWGPLIGYDVDITVDKNAEPAKYYTVTPTGGKEALTAEDQKMIDEKVDLEDLKKKAAIPTAEMIRKRLDKLIGEGVKPVGLVKDGDKEKGEGGGKNSKKSSKAAKSIPQPVEDDDIPSFEEYKG